MPQKPTMPSPYMKAVDASKPITFSCNIDSRDTIVDYEFSLYEIRTDTDATQYSLPSIYVGGTVLSDGFKNEVHFYKENENSREYTMVVSPTGKGLGETVGNGVSRYLAHDSPIGSSQESFTIGETTIERHNVVRIIYNKGTGEYIPRECFRGFKGLKTCEIYGDYSGGKVADYNNSAEGVVMGLGAFADCPNLDYVILPKGNIINPWHLGKKTVIPISTTFYNNNGEQITLSLSNEDIEEIEFVRDSSSNEAKLTQKYKITSLKSVTFNNCENIVFGESVFMNCVNLTNISTQFLKIEEIGERAFQNTGIEKFYINETLKTIGDSAFAECKNLSCFYIYSMSSDFSVGSGVFSNSCVDNKLTLYYLGNKKNLLQIQQNLVNNSDMPNVEYVSMYFSNGFTPVPIYGGNVSSSILSYIMPSNTLANDKEYSWCIKLTDSLNNVITSPHYYFKTRGMPNVELNRILSEAIETKEVTERSDCLSVTHDIYHDMSIVVEEYTEEIDDGDGGLMGDTTESVEILEDVFYYYPKDNYVYCNVSTSVALEKDDGSEDYYFQLPYYPIANNKVATIVVSDIEAGDNQIQLEYVEDIITDDNVVLFKFKVISEVDANVFATGETYHLTYDCCFEPKNYRIIYYFIKPLEGHTQSFYATYNMENPSDRYIPVKSHRWELYEKTGTENILIDETGEIFGAYLAYKYDKFLHDKNYLLKVEVENDEGFIVSDEYEFSTATADGNAIEIMPQISLDKKHNAVILDFSECSYQNRYSVIRKDASSSKYKSIANSIAGGCKVYDYTAASNTEHIYTVYELKDGVLSVQDLEPIVPKWSNTSVIGFNGSYADKGIISVDKESVWGFGLNIGKREYSQVLSKNIVSSIGSRFAKSISGKTNYRTFSLSGYLGEIDCESKYSNDTALLSTKWDKFAASPMAKFVVDTKGHVFICDVTDSSYGYADEYAEQPTTINVSFAEIAPSDDISLARVERGG